MKFLYTFLLSTIALVASGQQLTQVCIVDHNDDPSTIDSQLTLKYVVNTDQGDLELDAIKAGDCFTLNFDNIDFNEVNYIQLFPSADIHPLNGVSTFDLVLMVRHILGIGIGECSPLEEFVLLHAADINNNGSISSMDVLLLRQLILNHVTEFQTNTSWKFFDFQLVLDDIADPNTNPNYSQLKYSPNQLNDQIKLLGIKVGNINGICE